LQRNPTLLDDVSVVPEGIGKRKWRPLLTWMFWFAIAMVMALGISGSDAAMTVTRRSG
jgi:hypothetical protein